MKRPRDSQRSRLHAAEWSVFGWPKMDFKSIELLENYLWEVLENRYVQRRYPVAKEIVAGSIKITVANGGGLRKPMTIWDEQRVWVSFPRKYRTKWLVLHEIAHVLTPQDAAWHDREFARIYLHLVKLFFGEEIQNKFKAAMKNSKYKYSKPHSRWNNPPTQEEKRIMLDRLLVGRKKWLTTNGMS